MPLPLLLLLQHSLLLLLLSPCLKGRKVPVVALLLRIRHKAAVGMLLVGFRRRLRAKTLVILGLITQHSRLFIFHVHVNRVVINVLLNPGGQACWTKPWAC